jgi:hypothetical protein
LLILGFAGMYLIFFLRMRKKQRKAEAESIVHGAQGAAH